MFFLKRCPESFPEDRYPAGKNKNITSQNGDILINYTEAKEFEGEDVEHITVGNALINIDTVILNSAEASKIFDYILRGYRFKGILIIKPY